VDPRLHHVQGKAEHVTSPGTLLQDFYRDKLTSLLRHISAATRITGYDANNAYQYIINREETQLSWLRDAIAELAAADGTDALIPDDRTALAPPTPEGSPADAGPHALAEDIREAQAFVDRWRPRVEAMGNARSRGILRVILGETLEQKRMFEQALAGRTDVLGRHSEHATPSEGEVLPVRWIE
jgi:hypothetical protein